MHRSNSNGPLAQRPCFRLRRPSAFAALLLLLCQAHLTFGAFEKAIPGPKFMRIGEVNGALHLLDGSTVVFGSFTEVDGVPIGGLARLHADGSLDTTFVGSSLSGEPLRGVLQPDGKMLLQVKRYSPTGAYQDDELVRLNADGTSDSTFAKFSGGIGAFALQSDGRIVVGVGGALIRLNTTGGRDPSFFTPGSATIIEIAVLADDRIVASSAFTVIRCNADGSVDGTFQQDSRASLYPIHGMIIQPDGKILISCDEFGVYDPNTRTSRYGYDLVRLRSSGDLDEPFTSRFYQGARFLPFFRGTSVAVARDGKILIAGPLFAGTEGGADELFRLETTGELDPSFSPVIAARIGTPEYGDPPFGRGITIDAVGRVVLRGSFVTASGRRFNLQRLSADGSMDQTFRAEITQPGLVTAVATQQGDRVIVSGDFDLVDRIPYTDVVRLRSDASVDLTFAGAIFDANHRSVTSVLVAAEGLLVSERAPDMARGRLSGALVRVNAEATADSRQVVMRSGDYLYPLAIQPDGKIFAASRYSALFYLSDSLNRYNPDGTRDGSFETSNPSRLVTASLLEASGKFLIANGYTQELGHFPPPVPPSDLRRLNTDGTVAPSSFPPASVSDLLSQPDGRVIAGGRVAYKRSDGTDVVRNLARFGVDGTPDDGFAPDLNGRVATLARYPDGRILAGGAFTAVNGEPRFGLARFSPDGELDHGFAPTEGDGNVTDLAVLSRGQIFAVANQQLIVLAPQPRGGLLNISTRNRVLPGDKPLIAGFIITAGPPKELVVRGIGPSLPIDGALADPTIEVYDGSGARAAVNDNWADGGRAADVARTLPPQDGYEAALWGVLNPDAYTVVLRGKGGTGGIGVVEAYDLDQRVDSHFGNISSRGFVGTGDDAMIAGIIIGPGPSATTRVVLRAIGPSLAQFGISDALDDPTLDLRDANGTAIGGNDDWESDANSAEIERLKLAPNDTRESATLRSLAPGAYTAIVRGKGDHVGTAVVEAYDLGGDASAPTAY